MSNKIIPPPLKQMILTSLVSIRANIELVSNKEDLLEIKVNEPYDELYFKIHGLRMTSNNEAVIDYTYCPTRVDIIHGGKTSGRYQDFEKNLQSWTNIVKEYINSEDIFEDPLTKHYEEQFAQFTYIDEDDADISPFSTDKILLLGELIDKVNLAVEKSDYANENEKQLITVQGKTLKNRLLILSKNEALKQFISFTSKAVKIGFDVLKEVAVNILADLSKKMLGLP